MKTILTAAVIAALVAVGVVLMLKPNAQNGEVAAKESAYARVMRTGVLRCGYNVWPPVVMHDANTGKVHGIMPKLVEEAAQAVNLKVEWAAHVDWGTFTQDLANGRIDAMCAGAWQIKELAPYVSFTKPVFYNPVYPYVRANEERISPDLSNLNSPEFRAIGADGAMSAIIPEQDFPEMQMVQFPNLTAPSELMLNVALGKADIMFAEANVGRIFMEANPGKVKRLTNIPYRTFASPLLAFKIGENKLVDMFNTVTTEMQLNGTIDRIVAEYDPERGEFIPVAKPYQHTQTKN